MSKRKKLIIAVSAVLGLVLIFVLAFAFKNANSNLQNPQKVPNPIQPAKKQEQTEKLDIVINIHDMTTVYGEPIVSNFDFDFQILNKDLEITKEELQEQIVLTKESGQDAGVYAINGKSLNPDINVGFTEGIYKITKATYDMSYVYFDDMFVEYDGLEHEITVTGSIPEGVQIGYENNIGTEVGEYFAIAYFKGDSKNYYPIEDMTATLKISAGSTGITTSAETTTATQTSETMTESQTQPVKETSSDAKNSTATILIKIHDERTVYGEPLVKEFDFDFEVTEGKLEISKAELRKQILFTKETGKDVGVYLINGASRSFNPNITLEFVPGKYHIVKARYDTSNLKFEDKTFIYDGKIHKLSVSGVLPAGVSVYYTNNGHSRVGMYKVTAHFKYDSKNYYKISNMCAYLSIIPKSESDDTTEVSGTGGNKPKPDVTTSPSETDKPEETTPPTQTDKPEDTTPPTQTDKPEDTTPPTQTDKPEDTTPPTQTTPDETEKPPVDIPPDNADDEDVDPNPPVQVPDETVSDIPPGNADDEDVNPNPPIEIPDEPVIDIPPGWGDEEIGPNPPIEVPDN